MKPNIPLLAALLLAPLAVLHAAESVVTTPAASPSPSAAATTIPAVLTKLHETDPRMPSNNPGGWKMYKAEIKDPSLPRVLLIGDSILVGYRQLVINALEGKANVDVWINPLHQGFPKTPSFFKEALAQGPYRVIHFNIGLHGIQPGRIPMDKYLPMTRDLVSAIRESAPEAKLIWANITPVIRISEAETDELDPELNPVVVAHNGMAAQIMAEYKIPTNDLYTLMLPHLNLRAGKKDNYHWKPAAYELMTKPIVESIEKALSAH